MNMTIRFSNALIVTSLTAIITMIISVIGSVFEFRIFEGNVLSFGATLFTIASYQLPLSVFWVLVAYLTDKKKEAKIGYAIQSLPSIYLLVMMLLKGQMETSMSIFWHSRNFLFLAAMLAFGWMSFKNKRGLLLSLTFFIATGAFAATSGVKLFYESFEGIFKFLNINDLIEIRLEVEGTDGKRARILNLFFVFVRNLYWPLLLIVFWFTFNQICKPNHKMDWSIRTIPMPDENMNKASFSIIYWVLRTILFLSPFGLLVYLSELTRELDIIAIIYLLMLLTSLYFIASLYRNVLTSYFLSKGKYPSWLFLLINIPFINIFAWLASLFVTPVQTPNKFLEKESNPQKARLAFLQKSYDLNDNNNPIKVAIIILTIIRLFMDFGRGHTNDGLINTFIFIAYAAFIIAILIWYFNNPKAVFIFFALQILFVLIVLFLRIEILYTTIPMLGLPNLIIYYSLFHFDQFTFMSKSESPQDNTIE